MTDRQVLLQEAIELLDNYYHGSFKLPPQKCMPLLAAFVDKVAVISQLFDAKQVEIFNTHLAKTIEALQAQDYVLVKDYLKYEIRPMLVKVGKKMLN